MLINNVHKKGGGQIRSQDIRSVRGLVEARGIRLTTMNIRFGRVGVLEAAL